MLARTQLVAQTIGALTILVPQIVGEQRKLQAYTPQQNLGTPV
jgi:hypothetical protein